MMTSNILSRYQAQSDKTLCAGKRLKAKGEAGGRESDGWMASLTQ